MPKDPKWIARVQMSKLEYRGDLQKHINVFNELAKEASDMGVTNQIFNFVNTLPTELATKLADKRKTFKDLKACFDDASFMVVNKLELGKVERKSSNKKDKGEKPSGGSSSGTKRQWEKGSKEAKSI